MKNKRVELSIHTCMSARDGINRAGDYIDKALRDFMPAIAITDHDSVQAFPEAYRVMQQTGAIKLNGLKLIYGTELHYKKDNNKYNMSILAKNEQGLKSLYKILSNAYIKHYERMPIVSMDEVKAERENLVLGINLMNELLDLIVDGNSDEELKNIIMDYDYVMLNPLGHFKYYIEDGIIKDETELKEIFKRIIRICEETSVKAVASDDAHYCFTDDGEARQILLYSRGYERYDRQPDLRFRNTEEMLSEFNFLPEDVAQRIVIDNTVAISEMIDDTFPPFPQESILPEIKNAETDLKELSMLEAKRIYGETLPDEVADRLNWEVEAICKNGYESIYISAMKVAESLSRQGYIIGNRGMIASSLVAFLLKITEINPLAPHYNCPKCHYTEFYNNKYCGVDMDDKVCPECGETMKKDGFNIPAEFFMGFDGDKVPDIDLNLPDGQDKVAILEDIYGKGRVLWCGTLSTMAQKTAYKIIEEYCKDCKVEFSSERKIQIAEVLRNVKIASGMHPGGFFILPDGKEVYDYTPIQNPAYLSEYITSHYDFHSLHDVLFKFDLLCHDTPMLLYKLAKLTGVNPKDIPFNDVETMKLFETGDTKGIYDFNSPFVRNMIKEDVPPKSFDDLIRISGITHGTDSWLDNAEWLVRDGRKISEVISCSEDVFVYLCSLGMEKKDAFTIAEYVRKGKGINDEQFDKMRALNVPDWYIDSCNRIKYLFPRSHSATYTLFSYRIAYFKAHYLKEFYSASFDLYRLDYEVKTLVEMKSELKSILADEEKKGVGHRYRILELCDEMFDAGYDFDIEKVEKEDFSGIFVKEVN